MKTNDKQNNLLDVSGVHFGALIEGNVRDRFCTNTQERMGWTAFLQGEEQSANPWC